MGCDYGSYFTGSNLVSILPVIFSVRVDAQFYEWNVCVVFMGQIYGICLLVEFTGVISANILRGRILCVVFLVWIFSL